MTRKHIDSGTAIAVILLSILALFTGTWSARLKAAAEEQTWFVAFAGAGEYSGLTGPEEKADESLVEKRIEKSHHFLDSRAIPASWDSRFVEKSGTIRNQGDLSTCWAFASLSGLEAYLLPVEKEDFSVDHMITYCGFGERAKSGGTFAMALAYLTAWRGPVYEYEDPYNDGSSNPNAKVRYHLQEARLLNDDAAAVKEAVLHFGAVQSSMYADEGLLFTDASTNYFNATKDCYYYNGSEHTNHDVLIVGWDDNYSADNFAIKPPVDGAFLCQNSWGSEFGDGGYFYVSYADTRIIDFAMAYSRIDPLGVYDHIYQHDDLGWIAQMGFEEYSSWGANVFTAKSDELLKAAGFYAVMPQTEYEIYVETWPDVYSFSERELVASGKLDYAGYYTIDFNHAVALAEGDKFAIILKLTTKEKGNQLAAETEENGARAIVLTGQSYISADGDYWYDAASSLYCNLCLKGYTTGK